MKRSNFPNGVNRLVTDINFTNQSTIIRNRRSPEKESTINSIVRDELKMTGTSAAFLSAVGGTGSYHI